MPRRLPSIAAVLATATCAGLGAGAGAASAQERVAGEPIPGRYIVTYEAGVQDPGAATARRERAQGFRARFEYDEALKGFAAALTPGQVRDLRADPLVAGIEVDRVVRATASAPLAPGEPQPPTGVRRITAASNTAVRQASSVNVAVLDSGVDLDHPDLDAYAGTNCMGSGPPLDGDGHGTHVAGTIGALNNGSGVTGVAPGTRIAAVKVLGDDGSGSLSTVICGLDWVRGTRTDADPANDIAVANLSLGAIVPSLGTCGSAGSFRAAICAVRDARVLPVVAAGNAAVPFDRSVLHSDPDCAADSSCPTGFEVPAAYPEVLTVTAMSDVDGLPGTEDFAAGCDGDDLFASYTNWADATASEAHTIAAPGSCIRSTFPAVLDDFDGSRDGYAPLSGTSMAAPHVAGLAALCLAEAGVAGACAGMTPQQMIDRLRADAADALARPLAAPGYGYLGDPSRPATAFGVDYLGHLAAFPTAVTTADPGADASGPAVTLTAPASGTTAASAPAISGAAGTDAGDAGSVTVRVFPGTVASGVAVRRLDASVSASAWSVTPTGLGDGTYTTVATQRDVAGNVTRTGARTFTLSSASAPQADPAPAPAPAPAPQPAPAPEAPADAPVTTPVEPAPGEAAAATVKQPAKLAVARSTVRRADRILDVLAPITRRASGDVKVKYRAAGRTIRFTERIDTRRGELRIRKRISRAQARLGTGILTLDYAGDSDTRAQTVRLRAASRRADLEPVRPRIAGDRIVASGTISRRARGIVRVQLDWSDGGVSSVHEVRVRIRDGRFRVNAELPAEVRRSIAGRDGTLHSYVLFTGYERASMRGEMRSFEVLGAP